MFKKTKIKKIMALALAANQLGLQVINYILSTIYASAFLALIIIFQPELRRALAQLGSIMVWQGKKSGNLSVKSLPLHVICHGANAAPSLLLSAGSNYRCLLMTPFPLTSR